eukprot:Skav218021  [mRNA]  locus=scaffold2344:305636:306694:- [translate_table: standard]
MAIWFIGVRGLNLCWTCFFDDYTLISNTKTAASTARSAEMLFQLLGVDYAREGSKAVEFGTKLKTLGVMLDLSPEDSMDRRLGRYMTVGHTESRVEELSNTITKILEVGRMSHKEGERLRGRLQWFESFALGRVAQKSLRVVSNMTSVLRTDCGILTHEREALLFLRDRGLSAPPVKIHTLSLSTWLVFADGSCEGDDSKEGGVGAILISPQGTPVEFFSERVPDRIMSLFKTFSKLSFFQVELLPILCAIMLWGDRMSGCHVVFYTDNEAARGALIKGSSDSKWGQFLLEEFVNLEMRRQLKVWFARVPTSSNPADKPSRFVINELIGKGAQQTTISFQELETSMKQVDKR